MELKPCPFCDGTDLENVLGFANWPVVQCKNCGAIGPCIKLSMPDAKEEWNRRAQPAGMVLVPAHVLSRAALLLQTHAEAGMQCKWDDGTDTPNAILSKEVAESLLAAAKEPK